ASLIFSIPRWPNGNMIWKYLRAPLSILSEWEAFHRGNSPPSAARTVQRSAADAQATAGPPSKMHLDRYFVHQPTSTSQPPSSTDAILDWGSTIGQNGLADRHAGLL